MQPYRRIFNFEDPAPPLHLSLQAAIHFSAGNSDRAAPLGLTWNIGCLKAEASYLRVFILSLQNPQAVQAARSCCAGYIRA
ncbi:hypothetical protein WJX82_000898 [Trebouxia sp. C0006]